jgi:hypothetical protein
MEMDEKDTQEKLVKLKDILGEASELLAHRQESQSWQLRQSTTRILLFVPSCPLGMRKGVWRFLRVLTIDFRPNSNLFNPSEHVRVWLQSETTAGFSAPVSVRDGPYTCLGSSPRAMSRSLCAHNASSRWKASRGCLVATAVSRWVPHWLVALTSALCAC